MVYTQLLYPHVLFSWGLSPRFLDRTIGPVNWVTEAIPLSKFKKGCQKPTMLYLQKNKPSRSLVLNLGRLNH